MRLRTGGAELATTALSAQQPGSGADNRPMEISIQAEAGSEDPDLHLSFKDDLGRLARFSLVRPSAPFSRRSTNSQTGGGRPGVWRMLMPGMNPTAATTSVGGPAAATVAQTAQTTVVEDEATDVEGDSASSARATGGPASVRVASGSYAKGLTFSWQSTAAVVSGGPAYAVLHHLMATA